MTMTGYNVCHGDTEAVQMNLDNDEFAYKSYLAIIDRIAWWDDDDNTWNDVQKAAKAVAAFTSELGAQSGGQYGEIFDADLSRVGWVEIVTDVLYQKNLDEGREGKAGLE